MLVVWVLLIIGVVGWLYISNLIIIGNCCLIIVWWSVIKLVLLFEVNIVILLGMFSFFKNDGCCISLDCFNLIIGLSVGC